MHILDEVKNMCMCVCVQTKGLGSSSHGHRVREIKFVSRDIG